MVASGEPLGTRKPSSTQANPRAKVTNRSAPHRPRQGRGRRCVCVGDGGILRRGGSGGAASATRTTAGGQAGPGPRRRGSPSGDSRRGEGRSQGHGGVDQRNGRGHGQSIRSFKLKEPPERHTVRDLGGVFSNGREGGPGPARCHALPTGDAPPTRRPGRDVGLHLIAVAGQRVGPWDHARHPATRPCPCSTAWATVCLLSGPRSLHFLRHLRPASTWGLDRAGQPG